MACSSQSSTSCSRARPRSSGRPAAHAIVGIANRIEAIQFITSVAIGTAGAALVGQNLGAGRPDRAELVIRTGLRWMVWITAVLTAVLVIFPHVFLRVFSDDPEVLRLGVPYLRILATCLLFNGLEIVTAECVLGSGHTNAISWIFTSFSLLRIPLAFLAPKWTGMGVLAIAWVISLTCIVRALCIMVWAARGTWKRGLTAELHGDERRMPESAEGP